MQDGTDFPEIKYTDTGGIYVEQYIEYIEYIAFKVCTKSKKQKLV